MIILSKECNLLIIKHFFSLHDLGLNSLYLSSIYDAYTLPSHFRLVYHNIKQNHQISNLVTQVPEQHLTSQLPKECIEKYSSQQVH